jgi:hypothetical protein
MATPQPAIGDWYRLNGGALFEVVALDDGRGGDSRGDDRDVRASSLDGIDLFE